MQNHGKSSEELELFKDEYLNDPFREPQFVYKTDNGGYFQIHVDHPVPDAEKAVDNAKTKATHAKEKLHEGKKKAHAALKHIVTLPKKVAANSKSQTDEDYQGPRSFKDIVKDAGRQIAASAIIFFVGIVLLNWQAYSQIAVNEYEKFMGIENEHESVLEEIVDTSEPNEVQRVTENLESSVDPDVQKKLIPELELEVAPTDNRLIVPRIGQNIPIVRVSSQNLIDRNWDALEAEMQDALQDGVVHYPGTSLPGQTGNVVITGHSSYFPWDPGRFKDVFALLHDVVEGDKIVIYYEQDKYIYEVMETEVVLPEDIDVLKQTAQDKLTLITCTPVGTNLKRLIVYAEPIMKNGVPLTEEEIDSMSGVAR